MKPVALFIPDKTEFGTVFHPANKVAVNICGVAGTRTIPEDRLPYIRALGFEVSHTNGQPLPHPRTPVDIEA